MDKNRRQELLSVNSYLYCCKKKKIKGKLMGNQDLKYAVTKYDFIDKVIDNKNNLIIIAEENFFEYDFPEEDEDDEK